MNDGSSFSWILAGNSVCALVYGFEPYFYVRAPPGFTPDDLDGMQRDLEVCCLQAGLFASIHCSRVCY